MIPGKAHGQPFLMAGTARRSATVIALLLLIPLSACSSQTYSETYQDPHHGFLLRIPSGWSAPTTGETIPNSKGQQEYAVQFSRPPGFRIVVAGQIPNVTRVGTGANETHAQDPSCPTLCVYYQIFMAGFAGSQVRQTDYQGRLTGLDTAINSSRHSYSVELLGEPNISHELERQYQDVLRSFKVLRTG